MDIFKRSCVICNRKIKPLARYQDDRGRRIRVCSPCSEYAERRAFRRL